jgi:hypothetical protein
MRALLLSAVLACGLAGPAVAEEWRAPFGDFTITLPERWLNLGHPAPGELVRLGPPHSMTSDRVHECNFSYVERNAPSATQAWANSGLENMDAERASSGFPQMTGVRAFRNEIIDGVRVATIVTDQQDGDVYARAVFGVVKPTGFRLYMMFCNVGTPVEGAEVEQLFELVSGLRFSEAVPDTNQ